MIRLSAPSPAPPTLLRSTAGLSGVIVPYSLGIRLGAALAEALAAALPAGDGPAEVPGVVVAVDPLEHAAITMAAAAATPRICLRMTSLLLLLRRGLPRLARLGD